MSGGIFYRNVRARDQLELFLLAAVSSLLVVRFYLHITGYPQIATGGLHIAHMLWGGALMLLALAISISFLGAGAARLTALIGGVGFGVFIDELGKFITRDHNYFYEPTIGLIYIIFIVLYLTFNFITRKRPLSSREYQLNALAQLEEAIVHDMDRTEKARVGRLLDRADQKDPTTKHLRTMLQATRTVRPRNPNRFSRFVRWLDRAYETFWEQRGSRALVRTFFVLEALAVVASVAIVSYRSVDSVFDLFRGTISFPEELAIGQLVSSIIAAGFALYGVYLLRKSRIRAYEQFRRATLVNIFLTQVFLFSRIEFGALPGFFFNLVLLGAIGYAIRQEQRLSTP